MKRHTGTQLSPSKKRLWIISELYYPEENQTGYYITHIGEGLAGDFDTKVICSQPNYASRGKIAPRRETRNDVEIFRVRGTTLDKNVLPFRVINMLTNGLSVLINAVIRIRPSDEVVVVSAPPSLPFIASIAARIKKANYSLIIHDKYPEQLVATKMLSPDALIVRTLDRINRWMYKNARKVIVVGRDMQDLVRAQLSPDTDGEKVEFVPNWSALEEVEPQSKQDNPLLKEIGIADKFIFLYAGNMGHPQDIESIIECASRFRDHPDIRFIFIGSGVKRPWLQKMITENCLSNVYLLDQAPREQQTVFLNACDVGFVSLVKGMYGLATPSRTYNILAAGKPILAITEKNSEVERIIKEDGVGWTVEPGDVDALFSTIDSIFASRDRLQEMSRHARSAAVSKYSVASSIERYKMILENGINPDTDR